MTVALSIRKKWARGLIQETDIETQKIEATIKIEMIISNTNDTPVLRIDTIETIDDNTIYKIRPGFQISMSLAIFILRGNTTVHRPRPVKVESSRVRYSNLASLFGDP